MRSLLAIGTLFVLFLGIVPAHAVHAWLLDGPVCREACAGTDHCCCKKRQLGRENGNGDYESPTLEPPREACCTDGCGETIALQRLPFSRIAFRAEIERPLPETALQEPEPVYAARHDGAAPARPRAPPE
jgi:hypothetical protein